MTAAYQGYPEKSSSVTVSEATRTSDGSWIGDRSFEFKIKQADIGDVYTKVLGIRKKEATAEGGALDFTVFLASSDSFFKGEFSLTKTATDSGY